MRFYLNDIEELNEAKMRKIIAAWQGFNLPKLIKYKEYYDGLQDIQHKSYADETKPCNKVTANYCYDITTNYAGYMTGIPIQYVSDEDITNLIEILDVNDVHNEDNDFLTNALIYGVAFELNYLDEFAEQKFRLLDPRECIPVYKNDLERELLAVIRCYPANDLDNMLKTYIDVYTDKEMLHYTSLNGFSSFELQEVKPHYFGKVPVTVFSLNEDETSIFDQVMGLNDAYNTLLSSGIDEIEEFVDSYLVLQTSDNITSEEIKQFREDRAILIDEAGQASFLVKNGSSAAFDSLLDRLNDQIQKVAKCPDFNSETFMAQSGVAIRYKLVGMENQASSIESNMRKALQNRIELIAAIQKLTTDNVITDIDIIFIRNLPTDLTDTITLVNTLRGLVSDKTLLGQIPFVKDVDEEMKLLTEQKEEEKSSVYDFNYEEDETE